MSDEGLPVSGLRWLMAESRGSQIHGYRSWEDARSDPDSAVVISGDDGGTVYLTVPLRLVRCSEETIAMLATELDAAVWQDPSMLEVAVEHVPVGSGVAGGMGGGIVVDDVWLNPHEFAERDVIRARRLLSSPDGFDSTTRPSPD